MPPGPLVRRFFGPYERSVAEAYRHIFVNLDAFASLMRSWAPDAHNILEVGCGEGAMTERLARVYPSAAVTGIDITPRVGRLFRGNPSNVNFYQETVEALAARTPGSFDVVVLADVMHHVPENLRKPLLRSIKQAMTPNGKLFFKDWVISSNPIYWLCLMSDSFITGDKVAYFEMREIQGLVAEVFGPSAISQTGTVPPWRNNVVVLVEGSSN